MRTPLPNYLIQIRKFVMCRTQEDLDKLEQKMDTLAEDKYDWYFGKTIQFGDGVIFEICYDKPYEEKKS